MTTQKASTRWTLAGAAAALLLFALAPAPAWAGKCVRKAFNPWGKDTRITTRIQNTRKINLKNPAGKNVDVRITSRSERGEEDLTKGWKTLDAATGQSVEVEQRFSSSDRLAKVETKIDFRSAEGKASCSYSVRWFNGGKNDSETDIFFSECDKALGGLPYKVTCTKDGEEKSGSIRWTVDYTIEDS